MLEGLEITTKLFSDLFNQDYETFRIDAEHYQKKYLLVKEAIEDCEYQSLVDLLERPVITGHTPSMKVESYYGGDIKFVKTDNLRENHITENFSHYLSVAGDEIIKRSALKADDVIVTIIGATHEIVGRAAIIFPEHLPANINQNIALIRADKTRINSHYLNIFLNTKYGRNLLYYHSRQTEQVNLNCREVERVCVPILKRIESVVARMSFAAHQLLRESQSRYKLAESRLLEAVGLSDFEISNENKNIKKFSESFLLSSRIDAEYYQLKYDEILTKLASNNKTDILGNVSLKVETGEYAPEYFHMNEASELTFYIRSKNLKGGLIEHDVGYYVPKNDFTKIAKEGCILTARVGSLGIFGEVREEDDGAVYSDNVISLQLPDDFLPSVYTLLFNTKYYFELIDRLARGSVQQRLNQETLKELIVPFIDFNEQERVAELIEESFTLKAKCRELLEVAKSAVEIAIEEDENVAEDYIHDQCSNLDIDLKKNLNNLFS